MKSYAATLILMIIAITAQAGQFQNPEGQYLVQPREKNLLSSSCHVSARRLEFKRVTEPRAELARIARIENLEARNAAIQEIGQKYELSESHQVQLRECVESVREFEFFLKKQRNAAESRP